MDEIVVGFGDRVRDRHGTTWTVEHARITRMGTMLEVRCVVPSPSMKGLDVGDKSTLPACTRGLEVLE